jgi:hypothetical protein
MTEDDSQTPWGMSGVMLAGLAAVSFAVSNQQEGTLSMVLWGVGAVLLAGGLFAAYRS